MKDIKFRFGKKVKDLRVSNKISQEKLAELADIDRTYVADIESGKRNISITIIEKIAKAFNISISDIFRSIEK